MMNRISIILLMLFVTNIVSAEIMTVSWTGHDEDEWLNPLNWSPHVTPQNNALNTFIAIVDSSPQTRIRAGYVTDYKTGIQIDSLYCYGDIDLEFGEIPLVLSDPNGIINFGKFQISGSGVEHKIVGNFNNTDTGNFFVAYNVELEGSLNNAGQVLISPNSNFSIDANIINEGNFQIYSGSMSCGSTLNNQLNGTLNGEGMLFTAAGFSNHGTVTAGGSLHIGTEGVFENSGVLRNEPLGTLRISQVGESRLSKNPGTIEVNAGGIVFNRELNNEPNGIIELRNGVIAASVIKHSSGAVFEGFGGITGDLMLQANSFAKITGPTHIIGDLYIASDAVLQITQGTTIVTGKTTCEGTVNLTGGQIIYQGGLE